MKESEIKPCPFCNSEMWIYIDNYDEPETYMPLCSNHGCIAGEDGADCQSKEEATALWNKRAIEDEIL